MHRAKKDIGLPETSPEIFEPTASPNIEWNWHDFSAMILENPYQGPDMLRQRMSRRFDRIYNDAKKKENMIPVNFQTDRFVLFSDHHKGDASPADDFYKNAVLYSAALSYYHKEGFTLIVLGDNEELWENRYEQILPHYEKIIQQEIDMAPESGQKRKIRIWGNHDKEVSLRRFKKHCRTWKNDILENVEYREGLCLGKDIFLIHGHQGRFFEDKAWRLSRWAVQFIWKTLQKIFNIGADGPAENFKIRDDLELNYYRWAKEKKLLLICGHTHRAIFGSMTHFDHLRLELNRLVKKLDLAQPEKQEIFRSRAAEIKAEIHDILAERRGKPPKSFESSSTKPIPCYFNDGCCGYTNGITCIEIDKNTVRLIKWQRQERQRIILAQKEIQLLLRYIKEGRPIDKCLEPQLDLNGT
jgi:UDP-2,3-diacylglucosamine pyrophosphatase LpxH